MLMSLERQPIELISYRIRALWAIEALNHNLAIQDVTVPDGWLNLISNFVLLSKKEIKAIVEVD